MIENGKVDRSYLGVVIQPVTQSIAQQFGTKTHRGALVSDVKENTPAQKAGLQAGDIILKVNGQDVSSTVNLQGIVEQLKSGNAYDVLIIREGQEKTIPVKMEAMPDTYTLSSREPVKRGKKNSVTPGSHSDDRLGIEVQEITDEIANQLGLKSNTGVYISKVNPDSPLVEVGINTGDVILKYGKLKVSNLDDFKKAVEVNKSEQELLLQIFSDNSTRFFVINPTK
jgi:serine protease Do